MLTKMVDLSPDDFDVIERYPLNSSLDRLDDLLQEAEEVYDSRLRSYDGASESLDRLYRNAVSKLIVALQGADAAFYLRSRVNDGNIDADLADLFKCLRKKKANFNYDIYRALIHIVLQKTPDVDIWKAVHQLIETVSQLTPPATVPPTSDGTP